MRKKDDVAARPAINVLEQGLDRLVGKEIQPFDGNIRGSLGYPKMLLLRRIHWEGWVNKTVFSPQCRQNLRA